MMFGFGNRKVNKEDRSGFFDLENMKRGGKGVVYQNRKIFDEEHDVKFDSISEAWYFREFLVPMIEAGLIRNVEIHPRFTICEKVFQGLSSDDTKKGIKFNRDLTYAPDFCYELFTDDEWHSIAVDVKGYDGQTKKGDHHIRAQLFLSLYGERYEYQYVFIRQREKKDEEGMKRKWCEIYEVWSLSMLHQTQRFFRLNDEGVLELDQEFTR